MKVQTIKFKTKEKHRVCIHLKPIHFEYLKQITLKRFDGNISRAILYLLSKYLKYLYRIKKIDIKKTLTIDYQPSTKDYKRYWITINPTYWGNLYNLRFSLGYSMSYLLRIMIDWEMEENNETKTVIIISKPNLNQSSKQLLIKFLHTYAQGVRMYHISRWVYLRLTGYD